MRRPARIGGALCLFLVVAGSMSASAEDALPSGQPLRTATSVGLHASDLGVIINTADPLSVSIGNYYIKKRHIPSTNIIKLHFDPQRDEIPADEFATLKAVVDRQARKRLQAYALTWARPYRAGCMSITSAFALGLDPKFCASGCATTQRSAYFDTSVSRPYDDLHFRPTMSIAALDLTHAKALIDRGIAADGTVPQGSAYLGVSNDPQRNVRSAEYRAAAIVADSRIKVRAFSGGPLVDRPDVLFYFTGAATVAAASANHFLPGAVADHLTSYGGMLTDSPQMSSLRWLEAGATGSYGTVVEPCNYLGKFPNVPVLLKHYLAGETLIEAYWKSVEMPGQGLFIGEPLAAPFRHR
jgi:uncharacterized protein (TIGR03790 family)